MITQHHSHITIQVAEVELLATCSHFCKDGYVGVVVFIANWLYMWQEPAYA